jgi:cell wall-associated NlpC family hydrolase
MKVALARQAILGALRGRRLTLLAAFLALAAAAPLSTASAAAKHTASNWDLGAQRKVLDSGLMTNAAGTNFAGSSRLTAQADSSALNAIATQLNLPPVTVNGQGTVSVVRFDALLVDQLGLGDVAGHVQNVAREAGLQPPGYFGTEVLARYLGLRYDHPAGEDDLELYPSDPITRAEAAHSFAVVLESGAWATEGARSTLEAFALPHYDAAQLKVLRLAVSKIGMPYVWGGTTDDTSDGLEHGGYDCSGFAWRVYKVSGFSWGTKILGRTAAEQAGEIPKSARIHLQSVQPADLLFFGSAHFNSKATEANVIHEGIALSGEWAIHSSGQGVYVLPLSSGWLAESFTWARRVL